MEQADRSHHNLVPRQHILLSHLDSLMPNGLRVSGKVRCMRWLAVAIRSHVLEVDDPAFEDVRATLCAERFEIVVER